MSIGINSLLIFLKWFLVEIQLKSKMDESKVWEPNIAVLCPNLKSKLCSEKYITIEEQGGGCKKNSLVMRLNVHGVKLWTFSQSNLKNGWHEFTL